MPSVPQSRFHRSDPRMTTRERQGGLRFGTASCHVEENDDATSAGRGWLRRWIVLALVAGLAVVMVILGGVGGSPLASAAATAPAAAQCNPPAYPTGAGFEVTCTVSVVNATSSAGATSSTVTATACLAAAGVLPPSGCTTTVTTSSQLVTSVNQCNGIVFGGGSNVTCSVSVLNTVPTGDPTSGVTVDQCIGSGTGGGTAPTVVCAPVGSTTNATVTQCNGSGNGGGGSTRVQCNVSGSSLALPMSINQCNGSANGGGSTVTCTSTVVNQFVTPVASATTTTSAGTGGAGTAASSGAGGAGSGGGGSGGSGAATTVSAGGAGSTTGSATGVIPVGSPQTGEGGAARAGGGEFMKLGEMAMIGAALSVAVALRRRHLLIARSRVSQR